MEHNNGDGSNGAGPRFSCYGLTAIFHSLAIPIAPLRILLKLCPSANQSVSRARVPAQLQVLYRSPGRQPAVFNNVRSLKPSQSMSVDITYLRHPHFVPVHEPLDESTMAFWTCKTRSAALVFVLLLVTQGVGRIKARMTCTFPVTTCHVHSGDLGISTSVSAAGMASMGSWTCKPEGHWVSLMYIHASST